MLGGGSVSDVLFGVFVRGEARSAAKRLADENDDYTYDLEADEDSQVVEVYVDEDDPGVKTREVVLEGEARAAALARAVYGDQAGA
jgi:hypothetical protein